MRDNNYNSRSQRPGSYRSSAGRGTAANNRRRDGSNSSYGHREDNSSSYGNREGQNRTFRKREGGFSSGEDRNERRHPSAGRPGFRKDGNRGEGFRSEGFRSEGRKNEGFRKGGFRKPGQGNRHDYNRSRNTNHEIPKYSNVPETKITDPEEGIRLNKFIANSGICSRREADDFIKAGLVTVNGVTVTEMGVKIKPEDDIRFNGERLKGEDKVYIIMNKPKDVVTTVSDPHAKMTVIDLIKNKCPKRVFPVGRLDKSTTGVLLLTNDGDLAEKLTHPSFEKKKIYQATLDKNMKGADLTKLVEGITLEDGPIAADEASYVNDEKNQIGIEIHSGRNRIVRRMFEHLGYNVKKLDRVYFAGLTKRKLARGEWRYLTEKEVIMLKMGAYE